jgi:hypothetical protein
MMTVEGSRSVRLLVLGALSAATAGMFLISMRANYLYARSIGQSPETQLAIAWANVGADVWKAFGLIVVAGLWRTDSRRAAAAAFCAWAMCLCFSVTSAIGIYVQERAGHTGSRAAKHASLTEARTELATLDDRIKSRSEQAAPTEIEAAIAVIFARPVTAGDRVRGTVATISASCARIDLRTAAACAEVASLQRDLATSRETALLEQRAALLRERVRELQEQGATLPPDPVAQFWMWLSAGRLTADGVAYGMPLFFALMIEFVSTFGPVGIAAYAEATRRVTSRHDATNPAAPRHNQSRPVEGRVGAVIDYVSEHTEPAHSSSAVTIDALHQDYVAWCYEGGVDALEEREFARAFDVIRSEPELGDRIRKFGTRYYGIKLLAGDRRRERRTAGAERIHNTPAR